jgi:hypothetical protein
MENIPNLYQIQNKAVYLIDDLQKYDCAFFYGFYRKLRSFVTKKNLHKDDYIYAYQKKNEWVVTQNTDYFKAHLFLSKDWVENNVPKMCVFFNKMRNEKENNIIININILEPKYENEIKIEPKLLTFDDNEKFKDFEGNTIEIEVRGERNYQKCYFKVSDVVKGFLIKNLANILRNKDGNFKNNIHYKYFIPLKQDNVPKLENKNMYLTFKGMIKLLYFLRSENAEIFQDWANEKLFTIEFDTFEQKNQLLANLKGVSAQRVREVFSKSVSFFSCIYFFSLNTVKELRKLMNIGLEYKDDDIVGKWGRANDLSVRTRAHENEFGKLENVELQLQYYAHIDPMFVVEAEDTMRQFVKANNLKFEYKNHVEIIIISKKNIKKIKVQYDLIYNKYSGRCKELIAQNKDLQNQLAMQQKQNENNVLKFKLEFKKKHNNQNIFKTLKETPILNIQKKVPTVKIQKELPIKVQKELPTVKDNVKLESGEYFCKVCNYKTDRFDNLKRHNQSSKHTTNYANSIKNYECMFCSFTSVHSSSLSRHKKVCDGQL